MGGSSKNVFRRVVEWGDGWMPVRFKPEELREGCATISELARKAGRDPQSIEVLAFGFSGRFKTKDEIKMLGQAGVTHTTIWLDTDGEGVLRELEDIARTVL
jgi:alkanesulfonate monooxygenase SsuD/methylene tetrahydromethanopterin reductase-like flavin-dependent oxidoreductase (luciferase family)